MPGFPLRVIVVEPWLLGYSVMGMLSFPLESEIARGLRALLSTNDW